MKNRVVLLFVDDEQQFLESMKKQLEVRGFYVIAVDRGAKAVDAARAYPIDIALVDLKMPGLDGRATLTALKQEHPWMEVVILTGHGSTEAAEATLNSGAAAYLQKPCRLDQLLEVLQTAYRKKVMNRKRINQSQMDELLKGARSTAYKDVLRRLKEIDAS
ncbi:MAG: response regulator [Thermodesulfobacteriota bacterium]